MKRRKNPEDCCFYINKNCTNPSKFFKFICKLEMDTQCFGYSPSFTGILKEKLDESDLC